MKHRVHHIPVVLLSTLICVVFVYTVVYIFKMVGRTPTMAVRHCMSATNATLDEQDAPSIKAYREIYCQGPILNAMQEANFFSGSKYFVDMPLKFDPVQTLKDFYLLGQKNHDVKVLMNFVETHFQSTREQFGSMHTERLDRISSELSKYSEFNVSKFCASSRFAVENALLTVKEDVDDNPTFYSTLYVPEQFIIPGGRFRELYYWNSYWIIKGLLVSGMYSTAQGIIRNFGYLIQHYGFVPNGDRVYYLIRSQPPLLTAMVDDYYWATKDVSFVEEMLPMLEREFQFWTSHRSTKFHTSNTYYQYKVEMSVRRPESYREDIDLVKHLSTLSEKKNIRSNIASTTETGWDFRSRWFAYNGSTTMQMASVRTKYAVPVCLNAFICMNSRILGKLFKLTGDVEKASHYFQLLNESKAQMEQMHWNEEDGFWYDYDFEQNSHRKEYYISNAIPLFEQCFIDPKNKPLKVYNYLKVRHGTLELSIILVVFPPHS